MNTAAQSFNSPVSPTAAKPGRLRICPRVWTHALAVMICAAGCAAPLTGCQSNGVAAESAATTQQLVGAWDLVSMPGFAASEIKGTDRPAPNLTFTADGKVYGFSGINRVMSSFDVAAAQTGKLTLAQAASTMMAGPEAESKLEQAFLRQLREADSFGRNGERLVLRKGDQATLTFTRQK